MAAEPTRRRFTVAEFHQMGEAGILTADDRVELIKGDIVRMPPIGSPHASHVRRVSHSFARRFLDRAQLAVQDPLHLSEHNEPIPDIMLLRPRDDYYAHKHPTPEDVYLIVEVSDTTLSYDLGIKVPLYARYGVPEVWVVDLSRAVILVHRNPGPGGFEDVATVRSDDRLAPIAFSNAEIQVRDLLG